MRYRPFRRSLTAPALALAAATTVLAVGAPAHASTASPNGYVLYKSFGWPDACSSAGYAGQQAHQWSYYYCDMIAPASWDAAGLYDLYVSY
jgi:hypothetical protein